MARSVGITRERVMAVAAELADEFGLEAFTLAQVATRLGVKLPSLYNHIDGLPEVRRELALLGMRQLLQRTERAAVGKAEDAAIIAMGQAYRAYVLEHPGVYAALVRAPPPDDLEAQQVSQALIDVILTVLAPYKLDKDAAIHAVRGLRSIVHGFATIEAAGGFALTLDRDASFHWLLQTYVAGLRTARANTPSSG